MQDQRLSYRLTKGLSESYYPEEERLFYDPYAHLLLGPMAGMVLRFGIIRKIFVNLFERGTPDIIGGFICRTRYIDDILEQAMHDGIENIVILGAGMDTRANRIPVAGRSHFFEVDLPEVQEVKKRQLRRIFTSLSGHVVFVPLDLNSQSFEQELTMHGLNTNRPTLFILEVVTQYLHPEDARGSRDSSPPVP